MTTVPTSSDKGKLRFGFRTSAPVKVTLFHASEENRGPTRATEMMVRVVTSQGVPQKPADRGASWLLLHQTPSPMIPSRAATLRLVKMFWTHAPVRTPKILMIARNDKHNMAISCCEETV